MVHELLKKPLGEITYITKLAGFEYTKHFDYEVGGEIIALRSMNIKNGKLDLAEVHTIPKSVSDALPRSQLKLNDVVLGYVGSKLGNLAKIEHDNKFHLAPNVAVIRPSEKIDSDYLLQYMQSSYFQSRLWAFASSTGQPALSMTNIRKLPILLLNIDEQCKIAQILSIWDKAISTTESLINNSKQQKKALMQQLLTSKKRLLDESGKPFEGEWKKTKLSNIADIIMGSSPKSSSYNKISEGLPLIQGNADIKNRKTAPRIYTSEVTKQCRVDDILL
ncbi:MAG: restriction endonuclease subunit S, partial [Gammaproteobacteria bacterium]|nr:restriction endonuclease subunit S [Gammaproteobacteria bacterium]